MTGTTWSVHLDGVPLTREALAAEWDVAVSRMSRPPNVTDEGWAAITNLSSGCPLEFDVAKSLSSKMAQDLVVWLRSWMPEQGKGRLRLCPSIPTAEVARERKHPPSVRL